MFLWERRFEPCSAHLFFAVCVCVQFLVSVAQWLEQSAVNRKVGGSNPSRDVLYYYNLFDVIIIIVIYIIIDK